MRHSASSLAQLLESDLLQAGWDPSFIGPRTPDDELSQFVARSLAKSLLKKFKETDDGNLAKGSTSVLPQRSARALALFLENNQDCRAWREEPALCEEEVKQSLNQLEVILDRFCLVDFQQPLLSLSRIFERLDVGKGQSVGVLNSDFYSKFCSSELTTSRTDLLPFYQQAISSYPLWESVELHRQQELGIRVVPGSQLFFVPKNAEIDRVACTEPLLEMLYQKGAQSLLEGQLRAIFGISLKLQPHKNRVLARIGSQNDRFATIDLSSASDRNARAMIARYFPAHFVNVLERIRSRNAVLPDGSTVELAMMSSMGNAFTFPLQTILYASVVEACYQTLGIKISRPFGTSLGNYGVFGDDIIVRTEAYDLVCRVLSHLGHKVNLDKSFAKGPFRESCGTDWYLGHDVRGVYIDTLDDHMDFYSAINRLNAWSAKHLTPLKGAIQYLVSFLPKNKLFVPMHEDPSAGIRLPLSLLPVSPKWHTTYGFSYKALVSDIHRVDLTNAESFILALKQARVTGKRGNAKTRHLAKARYCPSGVLLSALAGRLRDGSYVVKEYRRRTIVKRRHSSCWDYTISEPFESRAGDWFIPLTRENIGELLPNSD